MTSSLSNDMLVLKAFEKPFVELVTQGLITLRSLCKCRLAIGFPTGAEAHLTVDRSLLELSLDPTAQSSMYSIHTAYKTYIFYTWMIERWGQARIPRGK